jgi:hypothetical protein
MTGESGAPIIRMPPHAASASFGTRENDQVASVEEQELEAHRHQIVADVRKLVEKYRAIFDWDVPDIDQKAADRLILVEVGKALQALEQDLLT